MGVSIARQITESIRPPRTVFVAFPMGHSMGRAFDDKTQRAILMDALNAVTSIKEPGTILDLPYTWKAPLKAETPESSQKK